jgi:uncharacterized membrane protein YagU involved in acid resistance
MNAARSVALGGLMAGVLDLTAAFVQSGLRGATPVRVLQSIAAGWLGRAAFQGGWKSAALGFFTHFSIATGAALVYCLVAADVPALSRNFVPSGATYGIVVYLFMYGVVLPSSAIHFNFSAQPYSAMGTAILIHVICVGLPIAFACRIGSGGFGSARK